MHRLLLPLIALALTASAAKASPIAAHFGDLRLSLVLDRSLVEREQERIEADCATPEDSPSTVPFSLSRPEDIVFEDRDLGSDAKDVAGVPAPLQPATWALFGLGGAVLLLSRPVPSSKSVSSKKNK